MNWFFIAILGYFLLGMVFILDKLILTKSVAKPVVYTFYSTIFMFAALGAWPFGVEWLKTAEHTMIAILSGLAFGFAMWAMFVAVKKAEASHVNPFIGGIVTIATYGLSSLFLKEELNQTQTMGIAILLFASFLLSFEKTRGRKSLFNIGFLWGIAAGILFAVSHISAKYVYDLYPFLTGFVWTKSTAGFVGLFCLLFPSVRKTFRHVENKKREPKKFAKRHAAGIVLVNKIMSVVAIIFIQYAIANGSVTLVNALSGLQYAFMFLLIYILTKTAPNVFKEYFTKAELLTQSMALLLVLIGSALCVL